MRREGYILKIYDSHHRFNRVDNWCLISAIDDATSKIVHADIREYWNKKYVNQIYC